MNIVKNVIVFTMTIALFSVTAMPAYCASDEVMQEIRALKARIEQLEKKLAQQDSKIEQQGEKIASQTNAIEEIGTIKDALGNLEFSVGATSVVQGTVNNDDLDGDDTDAAYSVDIEITAPVGKNGTALLYLEGGEGMGITDELPLFSGLNADATGDDDADLQISELWYEHSFRGGTVVGTIGKLDITRWFDANAVANDETTQFLSDMFVNNVAVEFPDYAYGVRLSLYPGELFEIHLGAVESDSDFEDIFDETFFVAEVGITPGLFGRKGAYRFYAWTNRDNHSEFRDPRDNHEEGYGFGLSFDQQVTDTITGFARFGWQDEDVYEIETSWSIGVQFAGALWGRQEDVFAMAFGRSDFGDDYRESLRDAGFGTNPAESLFEAYYSMKVNDHITIAPDVQVADGMLGMDNDDTVTILGVRAQLDF